MSVIGDGETQRSSSVSEAEVNSNPNIDSMMMIINRISCDVTGHVNPADDDVRLATAASE